MQIPELVLPVPPHPVCVRGQPLNVESLLQTDQSPAHPERLQRVGRLPGQLVVLHADTRKYWMTGDRERGDRVDSLVRT